MKKQKNTKSIPINVLSFFDEISNQSYLKQYKNNPKQLAHQIQDLKVLVDFALTNYIGKARSFINVSNESKKLGQQTIRSLQNIEGAFKFNQIKSHAKMAYEVLKKSSQAQGQYDEHQVNDRTIITQLQLKFMESNQIEFKWEDCFNSIERCLILGKDSPIEIRVDLKMQTYNGKKLIVWNIRSIRYYGNFNNLIASYYSKQLLPWIRKISPDIQESENWVLFFLHKSIRYAEIMMIYEELKINNSNYIKKTNLEIEEMKEENEELQNSDKQNNIFNLFDEKQLHNLGLDTNKIQSLKVCLFLLNNYSSSAPKIKVRLNNIDLLVIVFLKGQINITVKMQGKDESQPIEFYGQLNGQSINLNILKKLTHQILGYYMTYEQLTKKQSTQGYFLKIQDKNAVKLVLKLQALNGCLKSTKGNPQTQQKILNNFDYVKLQKTGINVLNWNNQLQQVLWIHIQTLPKQLMMKSQSTESGFINKILKHQPQCLWQQCVWHVFFIHRIQVMQYDWQLKLVYVQVIKEKNHLVYTFRPQLNYRRERHSTGSVGGRPINQHAEQKRQQMHSYFIRLKVNADFKAANFFYSNVPPQDTLLTDNYSSPRWIKHLSDCQKENKPMHVEQLLRATFYISNHFTSEKFILKKNGPNESYRDRIHLMDQ